MSTIWCEGQNLKMNGSFNAYLLRERPKIDRYRHHISMHRKMILEDDIKEYWGFYLLRGSSVRLSVCSRHEGAGFIIVKGLKDARRCSYLGELDSNEDISDDISDEFEFSHEIVNHNNRNSSLLRHPVDQNGYDLNTLGELSRKELLQLYLSVVEKYGNSVGNFSKFTAFQTKARTVMNSTAHFKANSGEDMFVEDYENYVHNAQSDSDEDNVIYDLLHQGRFNQKTRNDKSREEVRSSWSSSEEALARCEGLLYNVALNGGTRCTADASEKTISNIAAEVGSPLRDSNNIFLYN